MKGEIREEKQTLGRVTKKGKKICSKAKAMQRKVSNFDVASYHYFAVSNLEKGWEGVDDGRAHKRARNRRHKAQILRRMKKI